VSKKQTITFDFCSKRTNVHEISQIHRTTEEQPGQSIINKEHSSDAAKEILNPYALRLIGLLHVQYNGQRRALS
jgi:hypothetical protein